MSAAEKLVPPECSTCPRCGGCGLTTPREPLTKQQRRILTYIENYLDENGYAPTQLEIGAMFGFKSPATTSYYIGELARKGWIRHVHNLSRSIEVL